MVSRSCWLVLYFISYRRNISHCFTYVYGKTRSEGGKGNKGKFSQRSIWFGGRDLFLFVSRSLFLSFSFCGNGDHRSLSLIINGFVGSFSQLAPKVSALSFFFCIDFVITSWFEIWIKYWSEFGWYIYFFQWSVWLCVVECNLVCSIFFFLTFFIHWGSN